MYHAPISTPAPASWKDDLFRGDIVLFAFPLTRPRDDDYSKVRPCLILEASELFGKRVAQVAYGTASRGMANTGYDLPIDPAQVPCSGLVKPTRFVCARRIVVSLDNKAFSSDREAGTPVIGRLDGVHFDRMSDIRARIAAECDMAAERRELRRRARSPVTIERRRSHRICRPASIQGGVQ